MEYSGSRPRESFVERDHAGWDVSLVGTKGNSETKKTVREVFGEHEEYVEGAGVVGLHEGISGKAWYFKNDDGTIGDITTYDEDGEYCYRLTATGRLALEVRD